MTRDAFVQSVLKAPRQKVSEVMDGAKSCMGGARTEMAVNLQMACKVWHFLRRLEKHEAWEPRGVVTKSIAAPQRVSYTIFAGQEIFM